MQTIGKCMLAMTLATLAACSGGDHGAAADASANTADGSTAAASTAPASPQNTDAAAGAGTADADKTNPPAASKESSVNELQAHIPSGSKLLDSKIGDLNGDGRPDALLVLDHSKGDEKLGEGTPRTVVVLVRDDAGTLHAAAQNNKLVPCATCGGIAGDPYGYVNVGSGRFTIAIGGGSRERWSDDYTFAYADGGWFVDKVLRSVIDTETEAQKQKEFTANELGKVRFEDFDPAKLEQVTL